MLQHIACAESAWFLSTFVQDVFEVVEPSTVIAALDRFYRRKAGRHMISQSRSSLCVSSEAENSISVLKRAGRGDRRAKPARDAEKSAPAFGWPQDMLDAKFKAVESKRLHSRRTQQHRRPSALFSTRL